MTKAVLALLLLATTVTAGDNIVIVFDTSGSMDDYMVTAKASRITVAKEALLSVLEGVRDDTKVGILTFNGWAYDLKRIDKAAVRKAVLGLTANGGTPLYQYIKDGADRLLQERAANNNVGYYKLVVVTDGEAQDSALNRESKDGERRKPGVIEDIISRGIFIDAIGLEMRRDHALKNQINGRYMRGNNPKDITRSLKSAVAEVGFDGKDGISAAAFAEIADLPDSFVKASLTGLTEFRNYPIGESPLTPGKASTGGMPFWAVALLVVCVLCIVVAMIFAYSMRM